MKKIFKKEMFLLGIVFAIFLIIRSVYYVEHLNFSGDQATHSAIAMKLWDDKKITLIGNQITSIKLGERMIFQGPLVYYFMLLFLLPANFDPIIASYLFTIFCGIMIFPLYFGIKKLIGKNSAICLVSIYCFSPYYLEYTRFLWNPNSQFALIPILIYCMGVFKEKKTYTSFFLISLILGLMLQFHYQFLLVIGGIFAYYLLIEKINLKFIVLYFLGLIIGMSPLIIFELRNNFYNLNTVILFINNWSSLERVASTSIPHYYLSTSFFTIILILFIFKNKIEKLRKFQIYAIALALILLIMSASKNFQKPSESFWASNKNWNYTADYKIYQNIKETNIQSDFNVANLVYDAKSMVVKYLLKKDGYKINYDDYYGNRYLFVISKPEAYLRDPAYEVDFFKPRKLLRSWKINDHYSMYMLERLPK